MSYKIQNWEISFRDQRALLPFRGSSTGSKSCAKEGLIGTEMVMACSVLIVES